MTQQQPIENFFSYRNFKWCIISAVSLVLLAAVYQWYHPVTGRSGGTVVGYAYGILATIGIVYLFWYGIRKRSYRSGSATLQGWLSAHVWLGISLAFLVPLHAAFQFGFNVHTLAYLIMMIVIISGIYGAVSYVVRAPQISSHRGGGKLSELLLQIDRLSNEIASMYSKKSDQFLQLVSLVDFEVKPGVWNAVRRKIVPALDSAAVSKKLSTLSSEEADPGIALVSIASQKRALAVQVQEEIRTLALLKMWLWIHVPATFAVLVAVALHIIIVLWYR